MNIFRLVHCGLQAVKCEKKVQRRAIVYNILQEQTFHLGQNSNECPDISKYKLILNQFTHFCTHKILGRLIVWGKA